MRFLAIVLALVSAPAVFASGLCDNSNLPQLEDKDSFQAYRAKLLLSGFFPIYAAAPQNVPDGVRESGLFEFASCTDSKAFKGCYTSWLTRQGENVLIAFPANGDGKPFLADCPSRMRKS